jgi:hypothetical protein
VRSLLRPKHVGAERACAVRCSRARRRQHCSVAVAPSPGGCCIYCGGLALGTSHVASKMPRCKELFLYYARRHARGYSEYLASTRSTPMRLQVRSAARFRPPSHLGSHSPDTCSPWCVRCASRDFSTADSCLPHLRRDSVDDCTICTGDRRHICIGIWLSPATSAPGLFSPQPQFCRVCSHPCDTCAGTIHAPATSAPGVCSPQPSSALCAPVQRAL